ncbi:MAG TPA: TniQ family protein [Acetobacteraceae bacterium]|nr:TniQ family protein [Acetobacteraceae bacterium]
MTVTRLLPVAPRPLPGEAVLSWVRRVAARYDLTASDLVALLRTGAGSVFVSRVACLNWQADGELDALLSSATRLDAARIRGLRAVRVDGQEPTAWRRYSLAWCPECLRDDLARNGEVFERAIWRLGCCAVCPTHRTRLIQTCPACTFGHCRFEPVDGCQRLICPSCRQAADVLPRADAVNGAATQRPGLFGLLPGPKLTRSILAIQTDAIAALAGAAHGSAGLWPRAMLAGQFATMVRVLAGAFLNPWRLGGGRDARLLRDVEEEKAPARGACAFSAVKAHVAFDLLGIVAAVVSRVVTGPPAIVHAAECHGLGTRCVPVDLAWFTKRLTADDLDALCITMRGWTPVAAAALQVAITQEMSARKHAVAMREHARQEAAWVRRAAAQCAADAKRRIRTRAARKRRRKQHSAVTARERGRGGNAEQSEALRPLQQVPD